MKKLRAGALCGSPLSVRNKEVNRTVGWTGTITDVHRLRVCGLVYEHNRTRMQVSEQPSHSSR
jgi:hypothetical protein